MPTVRLSPTAGILYQAFTTGGLPLNAGLLYTYAAGTTTPQATYTTSAGSVQNDNPIVLGADGRLPNEVWLVQGSTYRFDIKTSADSLIASYDNISGINDIAGQVVGVYLPLAGGTMSGNLVVPDNNLDIVGSVDPTKILNFEVDGITAGQTRTITVPDSNLILPAPYATVAAHATTMDPWAYATALLTGSAVTFTDIADADFVGQKILLIMNAAHIWTDGAVFDVQGGATYTCAAGDQVLLVATAVDAFDVTILPANGGVVGNAGRVPGITLGTPTATTSGTDIDFGSIPSWVKRVTVSLVGVSTNGTSNLLIQIGTSGTPLETTYLGASSSIDDSAQDVVRFTTGFGINAGAAAAVVHGTLTLTLVNASTNTWAASGTFARSDADNSITTAGTVSLSGALDIVRLTTVNGTDAFDAGLANITY